jgi:NADPH:quinone reductase-like Zn-dependent oxidoreductase
MKAIVRDTYGSPDALELRDVDEPAIKDDGVLVRVRAAAVRPGDLFLMEGVPYVFRIGFGLRGPRRRIPGFDVAGIVEAVGTKAPSRSLTEEETGSKATLSCVGQGYCRRGSPFTGNLGMGIRCDVTGSWLSLAAPSLSGRRVRETVRPRRSMG